MKWGAVAEIRKRQKRSLKTDLDTLRSGLSLIGQNDVKDRAPTLLIRGRV